MATPKTETISACVDSYGSAVGMPQLCGEWMSNQIFWLVITLLVIFFVLSRIALPRIAAVLAERQGTITNDIAAAEDLKAKAAAAEEAYQQALIDARAEAARIVEATKAEIKADLDAAMAKADAEIADKAKASEAVIADIRANAMASVEEVAKATATELVDALGGKTDEKAINKAVDAQLKGKAMRTLAALSALVLASPAYAASGPFFSLGNTDFVVTLGFIGFILVLIYFKVPGMLGKMLDQRADGIKNELDEARSLRDEAQSILASYERKQKEVQEQAARIVEGAKAEAEAAAEQAKADLANSVARRMAAAEDQIASAQAAAEKDVRDAAVNVAIDAAREVIAAQLTAAAANKLIDAAISDVEDKLH